MGKIAIFFTDESGASVEYCILLGLLGIGVIVSCASFGQTVWSMYQNAAAQFTQGSG